MGLRLVLGRGGSGKSKLCQEEIIRELKERPDGFPYLYPCRNRRPFRRYALATAPGLGGTIRAQVLSFRRLAWKVMQEVGAGNGSLLMIPARVWSYAGRWRNRGAG